MIEAAISNGITNSRDKLRSLQILSRHKIGIPKTTFVRDKIEMLQSQKQNVLIQKFVAESKGRDIRAIVIGDRVVASMRRVAQGQEFRSNVQRGGMTELVTLDDKYRETAVRAAQIMGLRVAGVNILEGKDGPQVLEVNSSPGLEGIEGATKLDIAGAIIDYIAAQVDFPEIDLRQRLTISKGYGVSEIHIPEGSQYVGKLISDSGLREKDIKVLTLYRGTTVIPNPRAQRVLEAGDRLLCFGKMELMRELIPEKARRIRRPALRKLPKSEESPLEIDLPDQGEEEYIPFEKERHWL